jgi:hypothetical protein
VQDVTILHLWKDWGEYMVVGAGVYQEKAGRVAAIKRRELDSNKTDTRDVAGGVCLKHGRRSGSQRQKRIIVVKIVSERLAQPPLEGRQALTR